MYRITIWSAPFYLTLGVILAAPMIQANSENSEIKNPLAAMCGKSLAPEIVEDGNDPSITEVGTEFMKKINFVSKNNGKPILLDENNVLQIEASDISQYSFNGNGLFEIYFREIVTDCVDSNKVLRLHVSPKLNKIAVMKSKTEILIIDDSDSTGEISQEDTGFSRVAIYQPSGEDATMLHRDPMEENVEILQMEWSPSELYLALLTNRKSIKVVFIPPKLKTRNPTYDGLIYSHIDHTQAVFPLGIHFVSSSSANDDVASKSDSAQDEFLLTYWSNDSFTVHKRSSERQALGLKFERIFQEDQSLDIIQSQVELNLKDTSAFIRSFDLQRMKEILLNNYNTLIGTYINSSSFMLKLFDNKEPQ